jgi:hypothetical protein
MALSLGFGRHAGEHSSVGRERLAAAFPPRLWPVNRCHGLASHPGTGPPASRHPYCSMISYW